MTPDAVRLDLCTRSYEGAKRSMQALVAAAAAAGAKAGGGTAGAAAVAEGTEPWFDFPFVEAQLPASLRER